MFKMKTEPIKEIDFKALDKKGPKKAKRKRKLPNYFTIEQIYKLFNTISEAIIGTVCLLAFTCGLRRGEVCCLKQKNIIWEERKIKLEDTKSGQAYVTLRPEILPILKKWIRLIGEQEYLFPSNKNGVDHINPAGMYQQYRKYLRKADLISKEFTKRNGHEYNAWNFHTLRHSFCTFLLERGVNPAVVQKLMRHSKIKTTMEYYAHISDPVTRSVADEVFSIKRKKNTNYEPNNSPRQNPVHTLQLKLVNGEVSEEEYQRKMALLQGNLSIQQDKPSYVG